MGELAIALKVRKLKLATIRTFAGKFTSSMVNSYLSLNPGAFQTIVIDLVRDKLGLPRLSAIHLDMNPIIRRLIKRVKDSTRADIIAEYINKLADDLAIPGTTEAFRTLYKSIATRCIDITYSHSDYLLTYMKVLKACQDLAIEEASEPLSVARWIDKGAILANSRCGRQMLDLKYLIADYLFEHDSEEDQTMCLILRAMWSLAIETMVNYTEDTVWSADELIDNALRIYNSSKLASEYDNVEEHPKKDQAKRYVEKFKQMVS